MPLPVVLADGFCSASPAIVYQVPRGSRTKLAQVRVHNPNASAQVVQMQVNVSGTSRDWGRVQLDQYETVEFIDTPIELDENDAILLTSSDAGVAPFIVYGSPA